MFWILVPLEGVYACVGMVCYHCIVHILNSSKNFKLPLAAICAMKPIYKYIYWDSGFEKAVKKQKSDQSVPKILRMHAFAWPEHSKFTCNTLCILPVTMTCTVLC